eukprot:COSAG05_NODE_4937_length_1319_cov_1.709016_2_plen_93_part_01
MAALCLFGAVLVLTIPAMTTTSCSKIMMSVNNLRATYRGMVSYDLALKVNILEQYLHGLNKGQGPGFVILGVVVSVAFLQKTSAKIAGLSSVL